MIEYIYQQKDWPLFKWDHDKLACLLARVNHSLGHLIGQMEFHGFNLRSEALLRTLTLDVVRSSEIESELLDCDQVRSSIARKLGMNIGGLVAADRNVEGMVDMMLDATQNYNKALSKQRLLAGTLLYFRQVVVAFIRC